MSITYLIYRTAHTSSATPADAIIVLGASQNNGIPSPVLRARLDQTYTLYRAGLAPLIIVTGGYGEGQKISEAEAGRRYLVEQGVDPSALLQEDTGTTTRESLLNVRHIADQNLIQRIIIVSDGFHLYRAGKMAQDLGFTVFTAPAEASPIAEKILTEFRYVLREEGVFTLYLLFGV